MNGAIYGRTVSSAQTQRRRRLVMSFEMVRLDRALSEPLYQQLYRQIREELESGSFDSSTVAATATTQQTDIEVVCSAEQRNARIADGPA
jgi:hypothetical protein